MPSDTDIDEMRVLHGTLELAPDAPLFKNATIQVFVTFYDIDPDGRIQPTRTTLPFNATYVVPRGLRAQQPHTAQLPTTYYGYALHVFAGQILQGAFAKPKKLLDLPIQFSAAGN